MKDLIIVGASGFGREVLQWIKDSNKSNKSWDIKGFIDDNLSALEGYDCDYKVIDSIKNYSPRENDYFAIAIALPKVKKIVVEILQTKGAKFATIIHPTAIVGEFCELGEGIVMTPNAKISPNVKIGNFATILGSSFGHDAVVGDFCTITGNCSINGYVSLGEGSFIGSNSCIAPGKKVGAWSLVAMGSMVIMNVKAGTKVMGNPARKINI
ncbi:acetyltransferase [Flavobacterium ardleyense]|uniref:acetyltransferase n=1 Tax=Flavobacterium ardleyense TaxID=2038737 RepID=UPI00298C66F7|nr:acetyltransferase [Flavobacterium ardleyense]